MSKLVIKGVGYKCYLMFNCLIFDLGYTHLIAVKIPKSLNLIVKKNNILVYSAAIDLVMQFSKKLKSLKILDVYKGKGVKSFGENRILKIGKVRN
jgi:large subunit ribosomal protein L6